MRRLEDFDHAPYLTAADWPRGKGWRVATASVLGVGFVTAALLGASGLIVAGLGLSLGAALFSIGMGVGR